MLIINLLPVMQFDCISIKIGLKALCPPGFGYPCYAIMARVMMELLLCLLPRTDTQMMSLINMVRMESGNGYDLMWCILALLVPGFDPSILSKLPFGRTMMSLTLPLCSSLIIGSRPRFESSKTIAPTALRFSPWCTSQHMSMLLPLSCGASPI
jgi:hypothetical protein